MSRLLAPADPTEACLCANRQRMPDIAPKILLAICLLDRARSEASGRPEASPDFDRCRTMLNEIKDAYSYCADNGFSAAVDVTYRINTLMSTIERMMIALAPEAALYARLQRCINLLDEVDLILETFAVLQLAGS